MNQKSKQIRIIDIDKLDVYKNKRNCYSEIEDFVNSHKGTSAYILAALMSMKILLKIVVIMSFIGLKLRSCMNY